MSPRISKYLKFTSQRDGFDGMRIGMVKDGNLFVKPEEKDRPPPSKKSLGGEGDRSSGELVESSACSRSYPLVRT